MSGRFAPGRVTAIMGGSGAGKSTTLNVLRGARKCSDGAIVVNGRERRSLQRWRRDIGFVPQDDSGLDPRLSVLDSVVIQALLRLDAHLATYYFVRHEAIKALAALDLDAVAHRPCALLSGGQRKRLSAAVEFAIQPRMLLLDEPLSGLDSSASFALVARLRAVARRNVNVVFTLHQPTRRVFALLDSLLLLAKGGRVVYFGAARDVFAYVSDALGGAAINDADELLDAVQLHDDKLVALWERRGGEQVDSQAGEADEDASHRRHTSQSVRRTPFAPFQLLVQLYRAVLAKKMQLPSVMIAIVAFIVCGLLLGVAFFQAKFILPSSSVITSRCPEPVRDFTRGSLWNQPCAGVFRISFFGFVFLNAHVRRRLAGE